MENYQTIEPNAPNKQKKEVKDTIVSSMTKVQMQVQSQADLSYNCGHADLDNISLPTGNMHRPTRTQIKEGNRLKLENPYANLSDNDYEQRSPTVTHNYTNLNIGAVSGQKPSNQRKLNVDGVSDIEVKKGINEPFLSALSIDNPENNSSFELEVLQAAITNQNNEIQDENEGVYPINDEKESKRNEINKSINLPPASLIATKNTIKNIHHNVSNSFVGQNNDECNTKRTKFDDSDIGDLEENSVIIFRENSQYFDKSKKIRQKSQVKQSLKGLLDNHANAAPPLSKKSKAQQIQKKSELRDSEIEGEAVNFDGSPPSGAQLDFRLVYIDMSQDNRQEFRLSQRNFQFIPADVLIALKKYSDDESGPMITSLDISNNKLLNLKEDIFVMIGKSRCQLIEKIKAQRNEIRKVSENIQYCSNLQHLNLAQNQLGGQENQLINSLAISGCRLSYLNLQNNDIRSIPTQLGKLTSLQVLDLQQNKIRTLICNGKNEMECPLISLCNLEELYLNHNRLKDMPTVFHHLLNLKKFGNDWFAYIAEPNTLPKVVEEQKPIQSLREKCKKMAKQGLKTMNFSQFAHTFSDLKDDQGYDVDSGQVFQDDGRTSLHLAVLRNDQTMVTTFLKEGANPNLNDSYDMNALTLALTHNLNGVAKIIIKQSKMLNFKDDQNSKALLLAIEKLDVDLVKLLLERGLDPADAKDSKTGETCLHLLMYKMCYSRIPESMKTEDQASKDLQKNKNNSNKRHKRTLSRYEVSKEEVAKCEKIMELLLHHNAPLQAYCNQRYTPFQLAVRLGNGDMIRYLLNLLISQKNLMTISDLNIRTGIGLNTSFHIAAAKTNFQVLFELDKWGADIFIRNKENKTSFQVVNNNLLMLKIVKKLERKYYIKENICNEIHKIFPLEVKIISLNNILLNSGQYKLFHEVLQRLKRDLLRQPGKRNSVFSQSGIRNQSQTRIQETDVSQSFPKQSNRPSSAQRPQSSSGTNKRPLSSAAYRENYNLSTHQSVRVQSNQATNPISLIDFLTKDEKPQDPSDQLNQSTNFNLQIGQNTVETPSYLKSQVSSSFNHQPALPGYNPNHFMKQKFPKGIPPKSKQIPNQINLSNMRSFPTLERNDSCNVLETDRNILNNKMYDDPRKLAQNNQMLGSQITLQNMTKINQKIEKQIEQQQNKDIDTISKNSGGQSTSQITSVRQHKNIYFIKDQIFDKERLKQMTTNQNFLKQLVANNPKNLQDYEDEPDPNIVAYQVSNAYKHLHHLDNVSKASFSSKIQDQPIHFSSHRQVQEIKLVSQLKSIFNPIIKTHIIVLCDIIDKIYKLEESPLMISELFHMVSLVLQMHSFKSDDSKTKEEKNFARSKVRQALENMNENVNCSPSLQQEIFDILEQHPEEKIYKKANKQQDLSRNKINIYPKSNSVFSPSKKQMSLGISCDNNQQKKNISPIYSPSKSDIGCVDLSNNSLKKQTKQKLFQKKRATNIDYPTLHEQAIQYHFPTSVQGSTKQNHTRNKDEKALAPNSHPLEPNVFVSCNNTEQDISPFHQSEQPQSNQNQRQGQVYQIIPHNSKNPLTNEIQSNLSNQKQIGQQKNQTSQIFRLPIQPTCLDEADVPLITMRTEKQTFREQNSEKQNKIISGMTQPRRSQDVIRDQNLISRRQEQNRTNLLMINIHRSSLKIEDKVSRSNNMITPICQTFEDTFNEGSKTERHGEKTEDYKFAENPPNLGDMSADKLLVIKRKNIHFLSRKQKIVDEKQNILTKMKQNDTGSESNDYLNIGSKQVSQYEQNHLMNSQKILGGPVSKKGGSLNSSVKKILNSKQSNTNKIMKMQFKPGTREPATLVRTPIKEENQNNQNFQSSQFNKSKINLNYKVDMPNNLNDRHETIQSENMITSSPGMKGLLNIKIKKMKQTKVDQSYYHPQENQSQQSMSEKSKERLKQAKINLQKMLQSNNSSSHPIKIKLKGKKFVEVKSSEYKSIKGQSTIKKQLKNQSPKDSYQSKPKNKSKTDRRSGSISQQNNQSEKSKLNVSQLNQVSAYQSTSQQL